ncbi:hypothetical protein GCM10025868_02750 [Angustibacter aerolatus]|uniref:Uncharacterized protein n=1 Tax=Angustibacter aerolatus TaxID=1162965 RepID=A0ABQ6JCU5_9ACTN|nr:hypothetical protein GCM10025868_02750 [Angustibacter aerolatus]
MAAQVRHLQHDLAEPHLVAVREPDVDGHRQGVGVLRTRGRAGTGGLDHGRQRAVVVAVLVGGDDEGEAAATLLDQPQQPGRVVRGVDEQAARRWHGR